MKQLSEATSAQFWPPHEESKESRSRFTLLVPIVLPYHFIRTNIRKSWATFAMPEKRMQTRRGRPDLPVSGTSNGVPSAL
jgi:hypothetical protein